MTYSGKIKARAGLYLAYSVELLVIIGDTSDNQSGIERAFVGCGQPCFPEI